MSHVESDWGQSEESLRLVNEIEQVAIASGITMPFLMI